MVLEEESGYTMIFSGRQDERSMEGVGLALTPHARAAMRYHQAVSPRVLAAEFLTKVGLLLIVVAYAPTDQDSTEEKDRFYSDLDRVMSNGNGLAMVMGDFNASVSERMKRVVGPHGLGRRTSDNGERLISFANANGMCISNTFFPHKRIHQASWYPPGPTSKPSLKDYVLVKERMMSSVLDTRVHRGGDMDSDHRLVLAPIRLRLTKRTRIPRRQQFDVELLLQEQRKADYMETIEKGFAAREGHGSIEERWSELKKAVLESAQKHLQGRRKKQSRWMSDKTIETIEAKQKAFLRWQEQRKDAKRQKEYRDLCKRVRRAVKEDKEKWLDGVMKGLEGDMKRHRHRSFYKKMKRLTDNRIAPMSTILDERGQPLQKSEEKLERWKQHFEKVLNVQNEVEANVLEDLEDHSETDTSQLTSEEVEQAVKKLQNGKAAGEDEIVAEMLKSGGEVMIDWLLEILQEVWRTKQLPSEWKKSILVPVHKKKDRKVCDNYRGISLLSIPGKVLSLVLLDRLETIIDPQLMEAQCGFRKGRGTIDQIWATRQIIERATEYQGTVHLGFVDLTKAYDSVDRSALITILKQYRVPQQLIDIIKELYTGTWCCVRTEEGTSEDFEVKTGVRQGCVLSPLLFNCFMDRIVREAMEMTGGGLHVEYTTRGGLFLSYRDKTPLTTCIQNA